MAALPIETLTERDIPGNLALVHSAGWKDLESEWRALHAAADVRGVRHDGVVAAQCALADYGNSASLAKMVVAEALRGQGLAARLLDGFLAEADARGTPVGLCATELGRPLYASRGFAVSAELMILFGVARASDSERPGPEVLPLTDVAQAIELDRAFSGCDRARMLRARFAESHAAFRLAGEGRGFGLITLQGEHALVGPILAETTAGAQRLAARLLAAVDCAVRFDVPLEHVELRRWLVELGLREVSQRVEMTRGAARAPWQVPQRYVLATQAFG